MESYTAKFNLVLAASPDYSKKKYGGYQQDFDMHGSDYDNGHHMKGIAGNEVDIGWNTFFGANRPNFELRGVPCATQYFHDNLTEHNNTGNIVNVYNDLLSYQTSTSPPDVPEPFQQIPMLSVFGNRPLAPDPAAHLRVGDFDGDGIDDLFLATGAGWYYSPGGKVEWKFLSAKTEKVDQVLLGDFDGDGRTDLVTVDGNQLCRFRGAAFPPGSE
jgi:hypothetical protein